MQYQKAQDFKHESPSLSPLKIQLQNQARELERRND